MAFNRPSLTELNERITNDIDSRAPGTEPRLRRSLFGILGRIVAGVVHGLYGYQEYKSKQYLPDTADGEHFSRLASIWKVPRKSAEFAIGNAGVTGTNGSVIEAGSLWQRSDGVEYSVDEEAAIVAGTATLALTAVEAGANPNASADVTLTAVETIPGVDGQATVDADGLTNGADIEPLEAWRARVLTRIQRPPHGGAKQDYEAWALEVAGVTRAWVFPKELGDGTVTVRFVRDDDASIIPDAAEVQAVQDYIDTVRPVTADLTVVAPTPVELDLTIELTPNTTTVQAAVEAEIEDLLRRQAEPGGTILISHIREAISIAAGETDHALVTPVADITHNTGEMAVMGTITWQ
ncbi:baseplate J/gp47 family protein [uncultured Methylophaga sp.]|uniref:baseplate J/gp47 family protein n=1 Tax=uncultured Methylophaga sp. TaxID=285271 RepID=UPI00260CE927|nr:baseplate J/gp47 family protein [uncultured Methylophaga sp.]